MEILIEFHGGADLQGCFEKEIELEVVDGVDGVVGCIDGDVDVLVAEETCCLAE